MMTISDRAFVSMCYLVLMEHHGEGIGKTHPDYIEEKLWMLEASPTAAFGVLDALNQGKVLGYVMKWGYEVPTVIKEYVNKLYGPNYFDV